MTCPTQTYLDPETQYSSIKQCEQCAIIHLTSTETYIVTIRWFLSTRRFQRMVTT